MKNYILFFLLFSYTLLYPNIFVNDWQKTKSLDLSQNPRDRKLSPQEEKQRGIDLIAGQIIENIDGIDLRKMARSAIFETSYGFRWKMVNLHTGQKIIIKVDKDFNLISARTGKNIKT